MSLTSSIRSARPPFAVLCSLLVAACDATDGAPGLDEVDEWTAEQEVRVGSIDDPDYTLTFFRSMEVGADGSMYLLHPQEQVVRRFAADGTALGVIGGRGDGPGELQNAYTLGWVGDTLWILDGRGYRFNQYTADGTVLGGFSVPFEMGERGQTGPPRARGLLADGTVHGATPAFSNLIASGQITHDEPVLMDREGGVVQPLPRVPFGRNQWAISDPEAPDRGGMYMPQPLGDGPLWSFVHGERALVVLDREAPATPQGASFRITKLSFEGDTLFSRDYPVSARPVPDHVTDSVLDEVSTMMAERGLFGLTQGRAREWAAAGLYRPEYHPPVEAMTLGRDGSIWVSLGSRGDASDDWIVMDASGTPMGRVALPSTLDVLLVVPPLVYGTERDEFDVPYLLRYRIHGMRLIA